MATPFKQVADNAVTTTATSFSTTGITQTVAAAGTGGRFPLPGNGFYLSIWTGSDPTADPNLEIVTVTARATDTLTHTATTKTHLAPVSIGLLDVAQLTVDLQTALNTAENNITTLSNNDTVLQTALSGKAATSHTHDDRYYTESEVDTLLATKQATGDYATTSALTTGLSGKANTSHGHAIADVAGLQDSLNGKQPSGDYATTTALTNGLATKAATTHTHAQADITNLTSDLAAKQPTLVSGTNIKTINGTSLLGSGDITISGGSGPTSSLTGDSAVLDANPDVNTFGPDTIAFKTTRPGASIVQIAGEGTFALYANTGEDGNGSWDAGVNLGNNGYGAEGISLHSDHASGVISVAAVDGLQIATALNNTHPSSSNVKLKATNITGARSLQLPDADGTVALARQVVMTDGNVTAGNLPATDYVYIITGAHTVTLPTCVGNTNRYTLKNSHTANVALAFTGGETADGGGITLAPGSAVDLISSNTEWKII